MTARRTPGAPWARARAALLAAVVVAALAACVAVPQTGPVGAGVEGVNEPGAVMPLGEGPVPDASPQDIVQGFLSASAAGFNRDATGVTNNFRDAREFLSGAVQSSWKPREGVVVYPTSSTPEITVTDAQVQVQLTVEGRVDADGRYAEATPGAQESLTFDLVEDDAGQWRISGLDDGVVLAHASFAALYRSAAVYFLSPDAAYLVPETRWFPAVNLATSVVQALLAGPSPWLRDGVRTAVPDGAQLVPGSVTIDPDGTAEMQLSGAAPATADERALLLAQIEASLPQVRAVRVTSGGVLMDVAAATPQHGVAADPLVEVVQGDTLMQLDRTGLVPVPGVGSLAGLDVRATARNEAGDVRVLLAGPDSLIAAPTATAPGTPLLTGTGLVAPSIDRLGWVWTATSAATDTIVAVRADGQRADVSATWLTGRSVRSIQVARDGTRIAVLSSGPDGVSLDVAAVVRDAQGAPQQLGDPLGVGGPVVEASQVVWADDVTLGVLGSSATGTSAVYLLVPLGGQTTALPALDDAVAIAGGKGTRALYTATADGQLFWGSGPSWKAVATGVRDPQLPG